MADEHERRDGDPPKWVLDAVELIDESLLPNPWEAASPQGTSDGSTSGLTEEQLSVLASFEQQPEVPRLRGLGTEIDDDGNSDQTGDSPGIGD